MKRLLVLVALVGCDDKPPPVAVEDRAVIEQVERDYPVLKCVNHSQGSVLCIDLEKNPYLCFATGRMYYPHKAVCLWGYTPTIPIKFVPTYRDLVFQDGKPVSD